MSVPALSTPPPPATGLRRSALLMRALGARAAAVWSQLSPIEAERLSQAMQTLPEDDQAEQNAVRTYVTSMRARPQITAAKPDSVWQRLSNKDGSAIAGMIEGESPQVIALILSRLTPDAAADTVRALPRAIATEALKRLLSLGPVHPAAVTALERALSAGLAQDQPTELKGGHEHVARIFDQLDSKSEETLLTSLNTAEPGAREKIRALMFTFADLASLDAASMQTILGRVDRAVLTLALKDAPDAVAQTFFSSMTQRAGDLLREEMEATGPIRRSEIDTARAEILAIARTLVNRGDILLRDADDELVE